jgi:Arc/MetJ-type ribon-helix-helix transcriptional regulator
MLELMAALSSIRRCIMTTRAVRTTLALPSELLEATDKAVREGKARSRNEFVAAALRRELAARRRAEIDAEIAEMANDPEYKREAAQLMAEFDGASWEAFVAAEAEYHGTEYGGPERVEAEYHQAKQAKVDQAVQAR